MTDILGDIRTIIAAKRPDTAPLFFTDGLTWKQRKSDLRRLGNAGVKSENGRTPTDTCRSSGQFGGYQATLAAPIPQLVSGD